MPPSVRMSVMRIREVPMRVGGCWVLVPMGMPSPWDNGLGMGVAVVTVVSAVSVRVAVRQRLVPVLVFVPLGQVQADANRHQ